MDSYINFFFLPVLQYLVVSTRIHPLRGNHVSHRLGNFTRHRRYHLRIVPDSSLS